MRETGGRVQGHSESCYLTGVEFKVSLSTLARLRAAGVRQVCAFMRGDLAPVPADISARELVRVSFNPFEASTFYRCDTGAAVVAADAVWFTRDGAYAVNPR
jgi:hypothetical protein